MRKQTVKGLKRRVDSEFSIYIRLRDCLRTTGSPDYGRCITCEKVFHVSQADAGHFIPGRHNQNRYDETGCHFQCKGCNIKQSHGGPQILTYRRRIIEMYGVGYDEELERRNQFHKKFTIEELQGLLEKYRQKIKDLKCG